MKLTTKQKTFLSVLSVAIGAALIFIAFEYVPKTMGKVFLIVWAFIIVKWVNDLIKHNQNK